MATLFGIIIAVLITIASFSSAKKKEAVAPKVSTLDLGGNENISSKKHSRKQDSYPKYREPEHKVSSIVETNKKSRAEEVIDMKKAIIYSAILERPYEY